jgi:hypothetical protein
MELVRLKINTSYAEIAGGTSGMQLLKKVVEMCLFPHIGHHCASVYVKFHSILLTDIHALSVIRTHDPNVLASEDTALDRAATVIGICTLR